MLDWSYWTIKLKLFHSITPYTLYSVLHPLRVSKAKAVAVQEMIPHWAFHPLKEYESYTDLLKRPIREAEHGSITNILSIHNPYNMYSVLYI